MNPAPSAPPAFPNAVPLQNQPVAVQQQQQPAYQQVFRPQYPAQQRGKYIQLTVIPRAFLQ